MDNHLLSIVTFVPALAALILMVLARGQDAAADLVAKRFALIATSATFLISLFILAQFDSQNTGFQMVETADWILGLQYKMGVDGISVLFVLLTTFMMPLVIYASWDVSHRVKEYMIAFLVLETLILGVFMALDLFLFYLFFEAGLIPMFLIIGDLGRQEQNLCVVQILLVHTAWVRFDADRDDYDVFHCTDIRHSDIDDDKFRIRFL